MCLFVWKGTSQGKHNEWFCCVVCVLLICLSCCVDLLNAFVDFCLWCYVFACGGACGDGGSSSSGALLWFAVLFLFYVFACIVVFVCCFVCSVL